MSLFTSLRVNKLIILNSEDNIYEFASIYYLNQILNNRRLFNIVLWSNYSLLYLRILRKFLSKTFVKLSNLYTQNFSQKYIQ